MSIDIVERDICLFQVVLKDSFLKFILVMVARCILGLCNINFGTCHCPGYKQEFEIVFLAISQTVNSIMYFFLSLSKEKKKQMEF